MLNKIVIISFAASALLPVAAHSAVISSMGFDGADIVYNSANDRIYGTANGTAGVNLGNKISVIDPYKRSIERSDFIGSNPGTLAISTSGRYIYSALDGANAIAQYDTVSNTKVRQFSVGSSIFGAQKAEDISVKPGDENTIAVSLRNTCCSPRHEGVAVFENGVAKPDVTAGHTGSNRIEFGSSSDVLYGYNNETTEFGFRTMSVGANGAVVTNVDQGVIYGFGHDFEIEDDIGYSTAGQAFDPESGQLIGTYGASGLIEADSDLGLMFILSGSVINIFDLETFVLLNLINIDDFSGTALEFLRFGNDDLAILSSNDTLYFVDTQVVPLPAAFWFFGAGLLSLLGISKSNKKKA